MGGKVYPTPAGDVIKTLPALVLTVTVNVSLELKNPVAASTPMTRLALVSNRPMTVRNMLTYFKLFDVCSCFRRWRPSASEKPSRSAGSPTRETRSVRLILANVHSRIPFPTLLSQSRRLLNQELACHTHLFLLVQKPISPRVPTADRLCSCVCKRCAAPRQSRGAVQPSTPAVHQSCS